MSHTDNDHKDIGDDEIRIISGTSPAEPSGRRRRRRLALILGGAAVLLTAVVALLVVKSKKGAADDADEPIVVVTPVVTDTEEAADTVVSATVVEVNPFTSVRDTLIGRERLTILTPMYATPSLALGDAVLDDSTAVLVAQAADIRRDNGGIVGAYVLEGELLSKGEAKAGYCAIIKGQPTIGVAASTPLLEQALDADGYFFRQYPLVVAGQMVENRLKPRSLRKALAELDGRLCVILSSSSLTLNEFSTILVDLGVTNAIYLIGSVSYGKALDSEGNLIEFGKRVASPAGNVNYIVWR